MSIDVIAADDAHLERWDRYVERSPQGGLFHQLDALRIQADHAVAELHPLIGLKGQEPIGIFPVFSLRKGPIPLAFSPPPRLRVPYLGPAMLHMEKLKRRKADRRHRRFVDGVLAWVDENIGPWYTHARTAPDYPDMRPFIWGGANVSLNHTYVVDLRTDEETLLGRFSRDARSNVTGEYDVDYEIAVGGHDALRETVAQVCERYRSQGKIFGVPTAFVLELFESLPDGQVKPYVLRIDGEFVGGIVALQFGNTVVRWQGGVRAGTNRDIPVNDLLDWTVMRDAMALGSSWYDLAGADAPRINRYKAKFNPELRPFYRVEVGSRPVVALAHTYQSVK